MPSFSVLMAVYNRPDTTRKSLESLLKAIGNHQLVIYLIDASEDAETYSKLLCDFPQIHYFRKELYWNEAMRMAWIESLHAPTDFYLWLNDDVELLPHAIDELWATSYSLSIPCIATGECVDPVTGENNYGGLVRNSKFSRLRFIKLSTLARQVDTFNGNCVLVPSEVVEKLGILSPKFRHSMGDIDYGLRATKAGVPILQTSKIVATCRSNQNWSKVQSRIDFKEVGLTFFHPKGVPLGEWFYFCMRHGGVFGIINFFIRYLKMFWRGLRD